MRFLFFGKISTTAHQVLPRGEWVALEKVHGAQLVVGFDQSAQTGYIGKRKEWLRDHDDFFGWQLLAPELINTVGRWAQEIGAQQLIAYGELFGGGYPHPDVSPMPGMSPIQTGVWYHPGLRWSPFDLLICQGDDDDGEFVSYSELCELTDQSPFPPPPLISRGSFGDLLELPINTPTLIPNHFALPAIEDNIAEGVVLRPDRRRSPDAQSLLKRKIATFDDARFGEVTPWDPGALDVSDLKTWAYRLVNQARIGSARSKVGDDRDALVDEVVLDVMIDLEDAFKEAMAWKTDEERSDLEEVVRRALLDILVSNKLS